MHGEFVRMCARMHEQDILPARLAHYRCTVDRWRVFLKLRENEKIGHFLALAHQT